ncbi:MAG: hypothetical protein COA78_36735 [Blastopirellula sp.]|nr:MAG: hypothetical protein COA78_36735 [Blastopirellula sp.]
MIFKILYIEDENPGSIVAELSKEFVVTHYDPKDFEGAISQIKNTDLLLLDFRLSGKKAIFDAPTLAQTIRTKSTPYHQNLPIVLISSEENISGYYEDYTSQDLFDFAVSKDVLLHNVEKYSARLKSLINAYSEISTVNNDGSLDLQQLLKCPVKVAEKFSPRIKDLLKSKKYTSNTYMASGFILNHIVKPSGILIGEDILLARLGVSASSKGWAELKIHLQQFEYTGIFSESYDRWWFSGIEEWWRSISPEAPSLKRLGANKRKLILEEKYNITSLDVAQKSERSKSEYFWTICAKNKTALDPVDGFEANRTIEPWEDKEYFSLIAVSELKSLEEITSLGRKRYLEMTGSE